MEEPELLTPKRVARWLGVSPATLCRWRATGYGPRWVALSPRCPRYLREDVINWLRGDGGDGRPQAA